MKIAMPTFYRDYEISYNPKPLSFRGCDYDFVHIDWGGPEDNRHGVGVNTLDCKEQIDELLTEEARLDEVVMATKAFAKGIINRCLPEAERIK